MLKAVVCFVGAHYFSFVKSEQDKQIVWKLYDDERPIYKFDSWEHVLHNILQNGNLPTLLIYEKKSKLNDHLSEKPLNAAQLRDL